MKTLHPMSLDWLDERIVPTLAALDSTFGTSGEATLSTALTANSTTVSALANDGSVYLASAVPGVGGTSDIEITKITSTGSVDSTFGTNGSTIVNFDRGGNLDDTPSAIALSPDGTIVVAGTVSVGATNTDFGVVRFLSSGGIDTTFGTNGRVVIPFDLGGSFAETASGVSVLPDGRVVVGGTATVDSTGNTDFAVARLTVSGQLDTTFNGTGKTTVAFDLGGNKADVANTLFAYPDGHILIAGSTQRIAPGDTDFALAKLTSTGVLDTTFGSGNSGKAVIPIDGGGNNGDSAMAITVQTDGRIVLGGWAEQTSAGDFDFAAARLLATGTIDNTYGVAGRISIPVNLNGFSNDRATSLALDSRGRAILTGFGTTATGSQIAVVRLTPFGQPDPSFSNGGVFAIPAVMSTSGSDTGDSISIRPNGRIVVAGTVQTTLSGTKPVVAQLKANLDLPNDVIISGLGDGSTVRYSTTLPGISPTLSLVSNFNPFPGFQGVIRSVTADINGDGVPDQIYGTGPGGGSLICAFDGKTGTELVTPTSVYESTFTGGVFLAAGDIIGDGKNEIAISPDVGGGGRVVVFQFVGNSLIRKDDFFGIDDPSFRGGARVAMGDVNSDGHADLVVGAGFGGGPRVAIFNGTGLLQNTQSPPRVVSDFFAFPGPDATTLRNGVFVAAGDLNGDGFADLAFGGGPGGAPRIFVLSGLTIATGNVANAQASPIANYFVAGDTSSRGGVRLAVKDLDGDNKADLMASSGEGLESQVRVYLGSSFPAANGTEPGLSQSFDPYSRVVTNGVFVG
ncbi:MAG: FG-GAP-like repeat-containing protein [Gemmataceae bacterium]